MFRFIRRSLLGQLLGVYLLFVGAVLGTGLIVNGVVQGRLRSEVQTSDLALAQAVALETGDAVRDARDSLHDLGDLPTVQTGEATTLKVAFTAFKAARKDVDRVYWLDSTGVMRVSVPSDVRTQGIAFGQAPIFQRAKIAGGPILEAGIVDLTTYNAVVSIALPIRKTGGPLIGVIVTNLLLNDLSEPLTTVIAEQRQRGHSLLISMVDEQGQLIASPERERLLQPALDDLPGASDALAGHVAARLAPGPQGQDWLFTSAPVPGSGWAVIVQRPAKEAMRVVDDFVGWLSTIAVLFGLGGLLFWLVLVRRVIRPLSLLAEARQTVLAPGFSSPPQLTTLTARDDEVGRLARALDRLEMDVKKRFAELHTLLDTSTAVVSTLDPRAVAESVVREVSRLVDVQSATVRVSDEHGFLRVLASVGRSPDYDRSPLIPPDDSQSPAARALREGRPVQSIALEGSDFPALSYNDGFRAMLAIPIVSPHAGGMVLLVHRTRPVAFTREEVDLLLTFANYAALALEHAVLYERSDDRLREVALENARLYRHAMEEKQTLAAIMGSMSDGLILTGTDGILLYANPGAKAIIGGSFDAPIGEHIEAVHSTLKASAIDPEAYEEAMAEADIAGSPTWLVETHGTPKGRTIMVRLFDVQSEGGEVIGRGMLLRDVTSEQEIDRFKTSLLAAVSHEIRTPLAAIKGHASTLLQEDVLWSDDDQHHFLRTISDEADRLAQLMSNLLDLSRFEAGLLPITRVPTQFSDIVAHVVAHLNPPIPGLVLELEANLPAVEIDAPRIEVVLHNLLSNARAYGNGSVLLAARVEACGKKVRIQVRDNGPGLAPEELSQIFERFYRAPRGKERRSEGTGLGLAISKAFVEAHGQVIWAESDSTCTVISFTLPCMCR